MSDGLEKSVEIGTLCAFYGGLLTKRQQAQGHLLVGGIVQPEIKSIQLQPDMDLISRVVEISLCGLGLHGVLNYISRQSHVFGDRDNHRERYLSFILLRMELLMRES